LSSFLNLLLIYAVSLLLNATQAPKLQVLIERMVRPIKTKEATLAISVKTTGSLSANGVKMLVYGQAGAGKTSLIRTLPDPIVLSAEGGLLSIQDADLPFIEIASMDDLKEAFEWMSTTEGMKFKSVALDSISEIAEVVLNHEKKIAKDPRQAYGAMQEQMADIIRAFRDLPGRHVYMSAKLEKSTDEMGRILYAPSMPGNKTGQSLPYFFDEVLALRVEKDADGNTQRAIMCDSDGLWLAKDRSGKLGAWEAPDLGEIIAKIGGAS
jgi:phage nucleotide-binding protein